MKLKNLSLDWGQRKVRSSPYCNRSSCHVWSDVVSDHRSDGNYTRDLRRVFPSERTASVSSRSITVTNKSNSLTYTVASPFVSTSPLAVTTVVGLFRDPHSFQFGRVKDFPADHMHDCSRTQTNSLSSGCIVDAADKIHTSESVQNVVVPFLMDILGNFPRVSSGASLLSFGHLLRSVLTFHSVGTALMRNFDLNFPSDGPLFSRMFAWRSAAPVNRTRRIGPKTCVHFREIDTDSGGSTSCDTQPNCRTSTALLSPPFFGLLLGCSSTFRCGNEHSAPNLHPDSDYCFGQNSYITWLYSFRIYYGQLHYMTRRFHI